MFEKEIKEIQKEFIRMANEDLKEKGYKITDLLREEEFYIKNLKTNKTYYITSGIAMGFVNIVNYYERYDDILNSLINKLEKGKGIECEKIHESY